MSAIQLVVEEGFPFRTATIDQSKSLGRGAYGAVFKAKCDKLPCAAKLLHSIFFASRDEGAMKLLNKFREECKLLSTLSHPNIVQFIAVCKLRDQHGIHNEEQYLPVLLTELMDESLVNFIKRSRDSNSPAQLHTEVNIMYDIALALSYLHSRNVLHRDLSSNNVLLTGTKAKVTDFGVAKLYDIHSSVPSTRCPGTITFMSPEASHDPPTYSDKLDVFSWAVVCIHLLSRRDPTLLPGTNQEMDSNGRMILVCVPERERRRNDIDQIRPDHPLLPIALECLLDDPTSRPTADILCDSVEHILYSEEYLSSLNGPPSSANSIDSRNVLEEEIATLRRELEEAKETSGKTFEGKEQLQEQLQSLKSENERLMSELKKYEDVAMHVPAAPEDSITSIDSQCSVTSTSSQTSQSSLSSGPFRWESTGESPCYFTRGSIVTQGHMIYISRPHSTIIHTYNTKNGSWSTLSKFCPVEDFTLVHYQGTLVAVGGVEPGCKKCSKFVYTLINAWENKYIKSMFYARAAPAVVSSDQYLLVAGGHNTESNSLLDSVEIYDNSKSSWFCAYSLPLSLERPIALLNKDNVYIVGGLIDKNNYSFNMYTCSFSLLFHWSNRLMTPTSVRQIWKPTYCPIASPSAVVLNHQLYLIGGIMGCVDCYPEYSGNIFKYKGQEPNFSIFTLPRPRGCCLATVLPDGKSVFVVGGCGSKVIDIGIIND